MNQPNLSVRCPHCNLLNFASDTFCKRCKNSLQSSSNDPNSFNINININSAAPPRFNVTQNNLPLNNGQPPVYGQPTQSQLNQPANRSSSFDSSEYRLQNQDGFQQWRREQAHVNPPLNNSANNKNYPVPVYPPNYYPANMPTAWRRGSELIVHKYNGVLPDCCVKCGQQIAYSGGHYVRQKYRWHHPAIYAALVSPLIYAILSAVLSQRVAVDIPLCSRHLEERGNAGKFLVGGGVAAIIAIFLFGSFGYFGFAILIFLAALIGIVIGYENSYKPLKVSKIENDYIHLKKADHEFLNRLPNC